MELFEHYLTDHGGMGGFLALAALKIGEMIWKYFRDRDANFQTLQASVEKENIILLSIQGDVKKMQTDLNRAFTILKKLSGDKWAEFARDFDDLNH